MLKSSSQPEAKLVVVLGGCGFIGSSLCHGLLAAGYRVRVFKKAETSMERISQILDRLEVFIGDQTIADEVLAALNDAHTVVHLIHTTVPGSSMNDPVFDLKSNVISTASWLARLAETGLKKVVYVSSGGTVYGASRLLPIQEDHPLNPMSTYGITKLACERFVAMYSELAGIDYGILRPANAYGEWQPATRGQGILGVLAARIAQGKALEIWGDGKGLRDYVHVDDIVRAALAVIEYAGHSRIFNVSTGVGHSVLGLIEAFRARVGQIPEIQHLPSRGFDVQDNVLDNCRLCNETGWKPKICLAEGIDRLLAWNEGMEITTERSDRVCAPFAMG